MATRLKFVCEKCEEETDALSETKRADKNLCRNCFGKKKDKRENKLNELSGKEWAAFSKSVEEYQGNRSDKQREHGACFPLSLAEQQIQIYTKEGETVLDPFVGVGTTSEAAQNVNRNSIGIELSPEFVELSKKDIDEKHHKIIQDDVRNLLNHVEEESVDFLLTSPPYANLLKTVKGKFAYKWKEHSKLDPTENPEPYSQSDKDFGNLSYGRFLRELEGVFEDTFKVLKDQAYAVWVVKDFRDLKNNKPFVNFHSDVIEVAERAGFTLWDIKIYDQTRFRPLVVLGYPSKNYYLNIGHSYLLVFRKYLNGKYAKETN